MASPPSIDRPTNIDHPTNSYFSTYANGKLPLYRPRKRGRATLSDPRNVGAQVRHAIMHVFGALGSWEGMLAWAKDSPDLFYGHVLPKLLPRDLDSHGMTGVQVIVQYGDEVTHKPVGVHQPIEAVASIQTAEASAQAEPKELG